LLLSLRAAAPLRESLFTSLLILKHDLAPSGAVFDFCSSKSASEIKLYSGLKTDERPSHTSLLYFFISDIRVIRGSFIEWPQERQKVIKSFFVSLRVFL
jgi:hypothetical protein